MILCIASTSSFIDLNAGLPPITMIFVEKTDRVNVIRQLNLYLYFWW